MNKIFLVLGVVLVSGCQQLMHGQIQPVKSIDPAKGIYLTTCAGAAEDWASCYDKARQTCSGDYVTLKKQDDSRGTQRELNFQCKK